MRLMCDEMLAGLARWLRAAGYDASVAPKGLARNRLAQLCRIEDRVLLSRDRALAQSAGPGVRVLLLTGEDLDGQALALATALGLDWTFAPFTRCLVDNSPLRPADEGDLERLPQAARDLPGPFRVCPGCGRVFWPGSHVRRMTATLERWRAMAAPRDG